LGSKNGGIGLSATKCRFGTSRGGVGIGSRVEQKVPNRVVGAVIFLVAVVVESRVVLGEGVSREVLPETK
jgi:uncharacterized membrane-anchored protein YitT (DUF2179 family)